MKLSFYTKIKNGAWGGGNQFLKALKNQCTKENLSTDSPKNSSAILFNGYQELWPVIRHGLFSPNKKIIYRLGPIVSLHRSGIVWKIVDRLVVWTANFFADLVIFQSTWSYDQARKLGFWKKKKVAIIGNAVDGSIFFKKEWKEKDLKEKTKLVYTSWSSNMKKGFKYLQFLDEHLDFVKYEMTFIGNSPFQFKNIQILKALPSADLAAKLRESDIFISPVEDDACSNALLEGLASGLPVVALKSGGNPELVGEGGELFSGETELLEQIEKVAKNLKFYYDRITVASIEDIAELYEAAIEKVC